MLAPKDEHWALAEGRICITRRGRKDARDVEEMVARLDEFLAMLPSELSAYESTLA